MRYLISVSVNVLSIVSSSGVITTDILRYLFFIVKSLVVWVKWRIKILVVSNIHYCQCCDDAKESNDKDWTLGKVIEWDVVHC